MKTLVEKRLMKEFKLFRKDYKTDKDSMMENLKKSKILRMYSPIEDIEITNIMEVTFITQQGIYSCKSFGYTGGADNICKV